MIEKRLRRYKSRLKDRSARKAHAASAALAEMDAPTLDAPSYVIEAPAEGEDEVDGLQPRHYRRGDHVAEAAVGVGSGDGARLDRRGLLVFQHGSSGRVNIIYRRADGNIGWVDPPALSRWI